MEKYESPFIEWPKKSFEEIENIEIENSLLRFYYRSIFKLLHLPEITFKALYTVILEDPERKN